MGTPARRWDGDERGAGVASGEAFGEGVDALREHMKAPDWVTEDADAHLLHSIARACGAGGFDVVSESQGDDGIYDVRLVWQGEPGQGAIREAVFGVVGSFAESSTHVRQRRLSDALEFDVVTGLLTDETQFRTHGHLVRIRVEAAV